jgi:hypothetical protein
MKMKSIWLAVAGFLLFSALAWAAPLQDYSIAYTIKNPDGSVSDFIKYYLRDGNKFRVEYLHPDGVAFTIEILRKDKRLVWSMDPTLKTYFEVPLRQDAWEKAVTGISGAEPPKLGKTGTTKFLNYACDIYEVEAEGWTSIFYLEPSMNLILRSETKLKGETFQIREATAFSPEKPAAALFEIPNGYTKSKN